MLRPDGLIPLTGGAYDARGLIAGAQKCMNLYQESNPAEVDPPQSMTHYPRPGLDPLTTLGAGGIGRGIFTLSNGTLLAVAGQNVYYLNSSFQPTLLGQLRVPFNTPVSISDNGTMAIIVDGSPLGYTLDLATNIFDNYIDPTGTFVGATRVDYADTFLGFNVPGTNEWYTSLSNQIAFNALNIASKTSYRDPIQTLIFNIRQMWLIGSKTSEVWYLSGGSSTVTFPYSEWPNIFIPYGTIAPYSIAQADIDIAWLSNNKNGQAIIVKTEGATYQVQAISTRALEYELSTYPVVSDCIASSYQQAGHTFFCFHFPTADKTWVYDISTKQWHQRGWIDNNGKSHRERVSFLAQAYGKVVGQDWQTGQLYALDLQTYTDNLQPIVFERTFPHAVEDLKEITHVAFVADIAGGTLANTGEVSQTLSPWSAGFSAGFGPLTVNESPMINMRYSNDGGGTWSNYRRKPLFSAGHYRPMNRWRGLGMSRDRVYELSWSIPGLCSLQGAWLDPLQHGA